MHEKVSCTGCHTKPVFTDVAKNCSDCHADIHRAPVRRELRTVPHGARLASFRAIDSAALQSVSAIGRARDGAMRGMPQNRGRWKLSGAFHGLLVLPSFGLAADNESGAPLGGSAFAAANCSTCHAFDTWLTAKFDHSSTGFLLTNGHANVACALCHINNNYNLAIAPTNCGNSQCHLTTWQQTTNPVHPSAGAAFAAANCSTCHNTVSWTTATFDHSTTGFLLTNGHANVACASCHINNNYNLTIAPTGCGNSQCHLTLWQQTTTPVHSSSGPAFASANCSNCHTTAGWTAASFDHSVTGFTLVGTHSRRRQRPAHRAISAIIIP